MKKLFSSKFWLIALPIIIVCVIVGVFIRLALWDKGFFTKEPDWDAIEADIGAESSDFYIYRQNIDGDIDKDGVTTILLLGDDTFAAERGKTGVAAYLGEFTGATVFNCSFEGATASSMYPSFNEEYGNDAFNCYRIAASVAAHDFSLQRAYLDVTDMRKDYFEDTIGLLDAINFNGIDIIVLNFGVNDYLNGFPVSDESDEYSLATYMGTLRTSLDLLQRRYPEATIIVSGPHYVDIPSDDGSFLPGDRTRNASGFLLSTFMRGALEECQTRSITFLDNYFGMDCIRLEPEVYLEDDHATLTENGRKKLAERIAYAIVCRLGYEYQD